MEKQIAQRIGEDGWDILYVLESREVQILCDLQWEGRLDDETLASAKAEGLRKQLKYENLRSRNSPNTP